MKKATQQISPHSPSTCCRQGGASIPCARKDFGTEGILTTVRMHRFCITTRQVHCTGQNLYKRIYRISVNDCHIPANNPASSFIVTAGGFLINFLLLFIGVQHGGRRPIHYDQPLRNGKPALANRNSRVTNDGKYYAQYGSR